MTLLIIFLFYCHSGSFFHFSKKKRKNYPPDDHDYVDKDHPY